MSFRFVKDLWVNLPSLIKGRTPGQLIIQTTDYCNAKCPQCGMRVQEKFLRSRLETESIKRIIDRAEKNGVKALSFTGGEPFLFPDALFECIEYAASKKIPYLRTGTNGFMFMGSNLPDFKDKIKDFALKLKKSGLYTFWISLDSWDILEHETSRGLKGVTDGIKAALPVFAQEGIYPSANLGINRMIVRGDITVDEMSGDDEKKRFYDAYKEGFGRFYTFAAYLGFTIANACYPMSMQEGAVYKAESSDSIVTYNATEKALLFQALYDSIAENRSKIRIFTPKSSLRMLINQCKGDKNSGFACYGGIDYFFVNSADGHAYPCGFRVRDDMGKYENLDTTGIKEVPFCRECDWECFRDPSNQTGPLAEFFRSPLKTISMLITNLRFTKDWVTDILYYFACGMFNFKTGPDYGRMRLFRKN